MPALATFCDDQNTLLIALRQLISRQPESPGLLCFGARLLHAIEPREAGYALVDEFFADRTIEIAESIAITEAGGTDVIDSIASGPGQVLCPAGTKAWIEHAREGSRSVVVVTPFASRLPERLWRSYLERNEVDGATDADPSPGALEVLPLDSFDDLIDSGGVRPLEEWSADCPDVVEIARG